MSDIEDVEQWERDADNSRTWDDADKLMALIERAQIIIKQQGDALDQAHAREVRDEEMIADLRLAVVKERERAEQLRKDLNEEIRWGQKHARGNF